MTLLLVQPPVSRELAYPLGLATLAAAALRAGHAVVGCDLQRQPMASLDSVLEAVRPDVVGVTCMTVSLPQVREVLQRVRRGSDALLVAGGPHASLRPGDLLGPGPGASADAVVVGDGEAPLLELLDLAARHGVRRDRARDPGALSRIAGVAVAGPDGQIVVNQPVPQMDLDAWGPADRSVFRWDLYDEDLRPSLRPSAPVVTSRGCAHCCPWCPAAALWPRGWRPRDPKKVAAEMLDLAGRGVRRILVEDDCFGADRSHVLALCRNLIESPSPLPRWEVANGVRPADLDLELLEALAAAGCRGLALGIEAAPQVDRGSRYDARALPTLVARARLLGIEVTGYYMVGRRPDRGGRWGEVRTRLDDLAAFRHACSLGLDRAHFSVIAPLPGSEWDGAAGPRTIDMAMRACLYTGFYGSPSRILRFLATEPADPSGRVRLLVAGARRMARWLMPGR